MNEGMRVIELEALKIDAQVIWADILGMKYTNERCILADEGILYGGLDFAYRSEKLEEIAKKMRSLGKQ